MREPSADQPDPASAAGLAASERSRRGASTAIFAGATVISRVAGFAREVVSAALFGTTAVMSAFTVAFQIPNLIRSLVADSALTAAFVPAFTELNERDERERAWRVASTMAMLILLVLGPLTVACMYFAEPIVSLFVDEGFERLDLAVELFRIMMPVVLLMGLSGLVVGILNSYDHFSTPALAPVAWNLVILAGLGAGEYWLDGDDRIYAYAIGVLVGTVVQLVMPIPWLRGRGGTLLTAFTPRDPVVRRILLLMLPVTFSLGLINLSLLVNTYFSTKVPGYTDSGPAILDKAFRVYMLPQGIFSVAVSTVFFPALSRLIARGDREGFRTTFADGLRQIFVLLIPCTTITFALAEPMIRLLYERGAFEKADTRIVAATLVGFTIGMVFNGASLLLIRAFFSMQNVWIPTSISALNLTTNTLAVWLLHDRLGVPGIAGATSIVNLISFLAMYWLLRRRVGLLETRRNLVVFGGTLVIATIVAGMSWGVWYWLDHWLGRSSGAQLASMFVALVVGGVLYIFAVLRVGFLGDATLRALLRRRR